MTRIAFFIDGTFIPARDGASARFSQLPRQLSLQGHHVVVIHCYRGWSQLDAIAKQPFTTYFFPPSVFYKNVPLLEQLLRNEGVDILQANDLETMEGLCFPLADALNAKVVYEAHYHTSTLAGQLGATAERVGLIRKLEAKVAAHSDAIITFTKEDAVRWNTFSGAPVSRLAVLPFGVSGVHKGQSPPAPTLVFLGNMYFEPNERALRFILDKILGPVRQKVEGTRLLVIGDISESLRAACMAKGVEVLGEVDDISPSLMRGTIGLAPLFEGSGVRVKILEYLSHGLPVVASAIAAEGLEFPALFVEDCAESMAGRCVELLGTGVETARQVSETQCELRASYQWECIARRAIQVYQGMECVIPKTHSGIDHGTASLPMWLDEVITKGRFNANADESNYRYGIAAGGVIELFQ